MQRSRHCPGRRSCGLSARFDSGPLFGEAAFSNDMGTLSPGSISRCFGGKSMEALMSPISLSGAGIFWHFWHVLHFLNISCFADFTCSLHVIYMLFTDLYIIFTFSYICFTLSLHVLYSCFTYVYVFFCFKVFTFSLPSFTCFYISFTNDSKWCPNDVQIMSN